MIASSTMNLFLIGNTNHSVDMEHIDPLRDNKLLAAMAKLRQEDTDAFMQLVLSALKASEQYAIIDDAPIENKIKALDEMLVYFEKAEKFEECVFIRDLKQKIQDEKK